MGVSLGFENYVPADKIVYIGSPDTATARKLIKEAGDVRIIDCCRGKARRSIVLLDSGFLYFSHLSAETLNNRWNKELKEISSVTSKAK